MVCYDRSHRLRREKSTLIWVQVNLRQEEEKKKGSGSFFQQDSAKRNAATSIAVRWHYYIQGGPGPPGGGNITDVSKGSIDDLFFLSYWNGRRLELS